MPCWTVQTMELSDHIAPEREAEFRQALIALGYTVSENRYGYKLSGDNYTTRTSVCLTEDGRVKVTSASQGADLTGLANQVRRAYSSEIVRTASKRYGWNLTKTSERTFAAIRR